MKECRHIPWILAFTFATAMNAMAQSRVDLRRVESDHLKSSHVVPLINPEQATQSDAKSLTTDLYACDSAGNLFTIDLSTGYATLIGNSGVVFTDIAFSPAGKLFGIDGFHNTLYEIDPSSASVTYVSSDLLAVGAIPNALTCDANGTLWGAGDDGDSAGDNVVGTMNPPGQTNWEFGVRPYHSAGDLACDSAGRMYLTTFEGALLQISVVNKTYSYVGAIPSNIYGLTFAANGILYGIGSDNRVYAINPVTGASTFLFNLTANFNLGSTFGCSYRRTGSINTHVSTDCDGDGQSDVAVYNQAAGAWYVRQSSDGQLKNAGPINWGWSEAAPVTGDYDGDGKTDIAVFWPAGGNWYIQQSSDNAFRLQNWGWSDVEPVPADYDGDGKTDIAVYYPSLGAWYILQSASQQIRLLNWGWSASIPVPGDYDGDGKTDVAVYYPTSGNWYILQSSNGQMMTGNWGWGGAMPVPGDYDGDGKTDLAVYDPGGGNWYILQSSNGQMKYGGPIYWGPADAYIAAPADYDGDGKTDVAVYRQQDGIWYVLKSSDGTDLGGDPFSWGWSAALPVLPQFQIDRRYFGTPLGTGN